MKAKQTIKIQEEIPDTHYFVYKGTKYPINFTFFVYSSKFFLKNQDTLQQNKNINLVDKRSEERLNFPDKAIQDFIKYVHRESIEIDDENVTILNYLASKYEVSSLISYTQDYINQNQKDIIIDILIVNQNDETYDTKSYEEFISKDLLFFIKDDRLLSVNFPILYRIINRYEKVPTDELIEFYFKCLDHYGRCASILFTKVDFLHSKSEYFHRIMNDYSKVFDFHFIDFSFLKKMYDVESQIILKSKETEAKLAMQNEINGKLNDEINLLKIEIEKLNKMVESLVDQQSKQKDEMKNEVDQIKKKLEDEMKKLKTENENLKSENKNLKKNENLIEIQHQNGKEFQGIFKHLTDINCGNIHDNQTICVSSNSIYGSHHPKYLLDFNQNNFYNSNNTKDDVYIRFDFKEKSIQLFSYTIQSYGRSDGYGALRTWVIEASNDETHWQTIDKHDNDSTLNGSKIVATFNIQNRSNNFYRYIQLRRIGRNWGSGDHYSTYFYCIEFYGKLKLAK